MGFTQRAAPPIIHRSKSNNPLPITCSGLADLLGCTRSEVRDYANQLGFKFSTMRVGAWRKGVACLTGEQAATIAEAHYAELSRGPLPGDEPAELTCSNPADASSPAALIEAPPARNSLGYVYLLQFEPDLDPGRFKVGFSAKPWSRIHDHLTVSPFAECVAMWPARRSRERMAIVAISQFAIQIREEVYRGADIQHAIAAGDKFFAALPLPTRRPALPPRSATTPPSPPQADLPNDLGKHGRPEPLPPNDTPVDPPTNEHSEQVHMRQSAIADTPPPYALAATDRNNASSPSAPSIASPPTASPRAELSIAR